MASIPESSQSHLHVRRRRRLHDRRREDRRLHDRRHDDRRHNANRTFADRLVERDLRRLSSAIALFGLACDAVREAEGVGTISMSVLV